MAKKKLEKATPFQKMIIERRLRVKYPQMYKKSWVTDLKGRVKTQLKKDKATKRTKSVSGRLRGAGLTEKEIAKLRGKK